MRAAFTRETADVRRQALVAAAETVLAREGVGGTSVRAICAEAGVSAMASLAAALASALTRPLSPQAVLELATDTVAVLSVMVSQGQRQEPIEPAPDMVAALEALTAKPPVRKAL